MWVFEGLVARGTWSEVAWGMMDTGRVEWTVEVVREVVVLIYESRRDCVVEG